MQKAKNMSLQVKPDSFLLSMFDSNDRKFFIISFRLLYIRFRLAGAYCLMRGSAILPILFGKIKVGFLSSSFRETLNGNQFPINMGFVPHHKSAADPWIH